MHESSYLPVDNNDEDVICMHWADSYTELLEPEEESGKGPE